MNAGLVRAQGKERSRALRVTHEPYSDCLAYAAIRGLPTETDHELCGLLKTFAVLEVLEVASVLG
jgi:hypothetical protein